MVQEVTQEELQQVLEENEIVIVDVWAEWCFPCTMMGEVMEELDKEHPEMKIVKLDADVEKDFCIEHGIASIPTILVYKNGQLKGRFVGFRPKDTLLREIEEV